MGFGQVDMVSLATVEARGQNGIQKAGSCSVVQRFRWYCCSQAQFNLNRVALIGPYPPPVLTDLEPLLVTGTGDFFNQGAGEGRFAVGGESDNRFNFSPAIGVKL